jgi:hypothetical protein
MVPPQQQQQQLNYDSNKCMQRSSLAAATEGCSCMLFADLPSLQHVADGIATAIRYCYCCVVPKVVEAVVEGAAQHDG